MLKAIIVEIVMTIGEKLASWLVSIVKKSRKASKAVKRSAKSALRFKNAKTKEERKSAVDDMP